MLLTTRSPRSLSPELLSLRMIGERDYDSETVRVWIEEDEESCFQALFLPEHSAGLTGALMINTLNRIAHLTGQLSAVLQHLLLRWAPLNLSFSELSPAGLPRLLHFSAIATQREREGDRD